MKNGITQLWEKEMKVKDLTKLLKRFQDAELLIDGKKILFEAYENQDGKLIFNIKFVEEKNEKSLDK